MFGAVAHGVSACYREVPVAWRAAPRARDVRVTLDAAEAAGLAAQLGPRAHALTGRVVASTDSALTLAVTAVTRTSGTEEDWPGSAVTLPAGAVERLTVRRLAALPSALIAGLVVAGAGVVVGVAGGGASTATGGRAGGQGGRQ